jgi:hypothetical protein
MRFLVILEAFCCLIYAEGSAVIRSGNHEVAEKRPTPGMNPLTIFGLFAVTAMLIFYSLEHRNRWFILAFAGSCLLGSAYGFLQGAWPFGFIEAVWSAVAIRRWWLAKTVD